MQNQTRHYKLLWPEVTDTFIGDVKPNEQGGKIQQA